MFAKAAWMLPVQHHQQSMLICMTMAFARLQVPMERRINRVTAAVFHFSSGAVGSLTHSLVLHTSHYQTGRTLLPLHLPHSLPLPLP